jgi:hypothetical protein
MERKELHPRLMEKGGAQQSFNEAKNSILECKRAELGGKTSEN